MLDNIKKNSIKFQSYLFQNIKFVLRIRMSSSTPNRKAMKICLIRAPSAYSISYGSFMCLGLVRLGGGSRGIRGIE
jgi:hypothetical protein